MLGIVTDPAQLDEPPDAANLTEDHWKVTVTPLDVTVSVLAGLVVGLFVSSLGLLPAAFGRGGSTVAVAVALPFASGALALVVVRRVAPRLDARVLLGVAAGLVLFVALTPLGVPGVRVLLLALAAGLAALGVRTARTVRRTRAGVLAWNHAYLRLAADPRRAAHSALDLSVQPVGTGHRFSGTVTYRDDVDDAERTVPLAIASASALVYGPQVRLSDDSPHTVWHTPEHDVVLTLALSEPL